MEFLFSLGNIYLTILRKLWKTLTFFLVVFPWGMLTLQLSLLQMSGVWLGTSFSNRKWLEQKLQGSRGQRSALSKFSIRVDCHSDFSHSTAVFWALKLFLVEKGKETFDWQLACLLGLCREGVGMLPSYSEISRSEHSVRKFSWK